MQLNHTLSIPDEEIELTAIRAQGAGGQNVNKVSSAIHCRFDIKASSLPDGIKLRLLKTKDHRISKNGIITIKAQRFRTQDKNRQDALDRLRELILRASIVRKTRVATKPTRAAKKRRLDSKRIRGNLKATRGKVIDRD